MGEGPRKRNIHIYIYMDMDIEIYQTVIHNSNVHTNFIFRDRAACSYVRKYNPSHGTPLSIVAYNMTENYVRVDVSRPWY